MNSDQELARIKSNLEQGQSADTVTVRKFLSWFEAQRRGYKTVSRIRSALSAAGLETMPDFEGAYIDSEISFQLTQAPPSTVINLESIPSTASVGTPTITTSDSNTMGYSVDPTYRIGKLEAANRIPASVPPDAPLDAAVTRMLMDDISVVAVMQGARSLKGVITWKSIAERKTFGETSTMAQSYMEQAEKVESDRSLFATIPTIVDRGYVLVMEHGSVKGVVTSRDLSLQFKQLSEPFLLLSEIENQIRRLIGSKLNIEDIQSAADPNDSDRTVNDVSDLTFGEYVRLLQNPSQWTKLQLSLDRQLFTSRLDQVRIIRNDVMHFDPDGIAESELDKLHSFARFLRQMTEITPRDTATTGSR